MKLIRFIMILITGLATIAVAAQDNYYNSRQYQTNQYKSLSAATQRAYTVPDRPYTPSSSGSSSSSSGASYSSSTRSTTNITPATGPGSKGYSDIGAYDKVRRQEEAGRQLEERRKARMAAMAAAEKQYAALISDHGNAKTDEDHYDLVLRGMRAGIDMTAVFNVIGRNMEGYRAKFGNKPNVPYKNSAAISYELYTKAYTTQLTKMISETKDPNSRYIFLKEIIKTDPTFENYFAMGENALAAKQYEDARDAFKTAHAKNASHFAALAGYGEALFMLGDAAAAEIEYKKALALNEENADVFFKTAWATYLQGKYDETYDLVKEAAALLPDDAGPYLLLAALQPEGKARDTLLTNAKAVQPVIKQAKLGDMLMAYAKYLQANKGTGISVFYLDLAVATDPKNFDYLELRYGTNKLLKRGKQAAIDEQLLDKL